jgi:hypothetical protein
MVATKTILLLAANPIGPHPTHNAYLRLQEEEREIKERLRLAGYGKTPIHSAVAVRARDVQQAMVDFEPQVVHFSGHGIGEEGLLFEDATGHAKLVSSEALAGLFALFSNQVECVVLNACFSDAQAQAIAQHIPHVIGMNQTIGDRAAIEFSIGFYTALGAGKSYEFAYKLGCSAIQLAGLPGHRTPVLIQPSSSAPVQPDLTKNAQTISQKRESGESLSVNQDTISDSEQSTEFKRQRLEKQRTNFQAEWDTRTEKLAQLRQAFIIETSASIRFQLEKQIQTEEEEINRLENLLSNIEQDLKRETVASTAQKSSQAEISRTGTAIIQPSSPPLKAEPSPNEHGDVIPLINAVFDALSHANAAAAIQEFEAIAHRSLFLNGHLDPNFRKTDFNAAIARIHFYKRPIEILDRHPTGRTRLGSRPDREDGYEEKITISRNDNSGGLPGHIRLFFPANGGAAKISGLSF